MLNNQHFYYRTIRKNVIAFGTLFKNIQLVRYAKDSYNEIDRYNVPLSYASKEDFVKKLYTDPDLLKHTQINLPRMTFEMTGIEYDSSRKLSSYNTIYNSVSGSNSSATKMYAGTPYNLTFELNIYVRNVEDGTQIVEQIFPYFNPDYTLSMTFIDNTDIKRDVPIILENISHVRDEDGPAETTVRTIVWTLTFKMKTYFFGPSSAAKIIRHSEANIYNDVSSTGMVVDLTLGTGTSPYKHGEQVYQGQQYNPTASGIVVSWDDINSILRVSMDNGQFSNTTNVIGSLTGTSRSITSIDTQPVLLAKIVVTPNPPTANIGDDFGYTEIIYEFPNL